MIFGKIYGGFTTASIRLRANNFYEGYLMKYYWDKLLTVELVTLETKLRMTG